MNIRETTSIRSPNGIDEKCAKFIIDEAGKPFVFRFTTNENQKYAFSSWVRAEVDSTIIVDSKEIPVTTEWERIKVEYEASSSSLKLYFNEVGTYYFYKSQLEIGNVSTDWAPSPEDVNASLEVKVNIDDLISEINASANVIRLKSNRLVVESDNLQILEDGTLKTQRGEIGGFVLDDNVLLAESDSYAEINIKYQTHADAEIREGFIRIGNNPDDDENTGDAGITVEDYDLDGNEIYTRIGNVLGGGILVTTTEPHEALHIDYDGISRVDNHPVRINGMEYGVNKVLWFGGMFMGADHTAKLSEAISSQANGIVLVWSWYDNSQPYNNNWNSFFVPKQLVASHSGTSFSFFIARANLAAACQKSLIISDTVITGVATNNQASATSSGITNTPNNFVLRYVYGV